MTDQTARMRQLADTLNQASQAYYFGSEPIMSDMDWDKLYDELSALEKETGIVLQDSPTHRVGGEVMTAFAPHTHIHRLWSMDRRGGGLDSPHREAQRAGRPAILC